jgi:hypothetical protein
MLASCSPVKCDALFEWNSSVRVAAGAEVHIGQQADTSYAQPASFSSAKTCMAERLRQNPQPTAEMAVVAIENFIERQEDGTWIDVCAVAAFYVDKHGFLTTEIKRGPVCVCVPAEYAPTGEILPGYNKTVGSRVHEVFPDVSSQDWFQAVDPNNVNRTEQIKAALACLSFPDVE